jgi:hypothetical protein
MFSDLREYLSHYLVLLAILGGGLFLFLFFSHSPQAQLQITFLIASTYLIWGLVHHYLKKDLNWLVVVEYTLVAAFSVMVIYTVLKQV